LQLTDHWLLIFFATRVLLRLPTGCVCANAHGTQPAYARTELQSMLEKPTDNLHCWDVQAEPQKAVCCMTQPVTCSN
jgi:hypothetical protein